MQRKTLKRPVPVKIIYLFDVFNMLWIMLIDHMFTNRLFPDSLDVSSA